jgi:uncharacterized membrane protein
VAEPEPQGILSTDRLDALTDGVFAFAMTLLVINLEFPDDFDPKSNADLVAALLDLSDALLVYVISFVVLATRWIGQAQNRPRAEVVGGAHAWWVLLHLFFITLVPFSTLVVGRYDFPAAVILYGANMAAAALVAVRISFLEEKETGKRLAHTGRLDLIVLALSAGLAIALSLADVSGAMWAYLLNFAKPLFARVRWLAPLQ